MNILATKESLEFEARIECPPRRKDPGYACGNEATRVWQLQQVYSQDGQAGAVISQDRIIRTLKDFKTKISKVKVTRSRNLLAAKAVSDGHIDSNFVRICFLGN